MFLNDAIVRPYVGDYLVVIFLYCLVRSFIKTPVLLTAMGVLHFAYLIEMLQYLNIIALLGLQDNKLATVVIGYHFEWVDMLAYTLGIVTVIIYERMRDYKSQSVIRNL